MYEYDFDGPDFAEPGGRSALRAARRGNPWSDRPRKEAIDGVNYLRLGAYYRVPGGFVVRVVDKAKPHPAFCTYTLESMEHIGPDPKGHRFKVTNPERFVRVKRWPE